MSTTDPSVTDSFSGLAERAEAMLGAAEVAATTPVTEATPTTPVVEATPAVETSSTESTSDPTLTQATSADPTPLDVAPDTLIKVKINGQDQIVKAGEFKDMIQQTSVFTQRTQALSQQQRQLEDYFAQREAQLLARQQYLEQAAQQLQAQQDPVQVLQQALARTQPTAQAPGPNEIATHGEIRQIVQALQQQMAQQVAQVKTEATTTAEQRVEQARQEMWIQQEQQKATAGFQQLMSTEDGKLLAEVNPLAEPALRFTVAKMGPRSTEEALEFASKVAKDWAGNIRGKMVQQQKVEAVVKAKTVMEPPAQGAAPTLVQASTKPQSFLKKDGSIDHAAMTARAMAIMESLT